MLYNTVKKKKTVIDKYTPRETRELPTNICKDEIVCAIVPHNVTCKVYFKIK